MEEIQALFSIAHKMLILSFEVSDTGPISKTEFQLTKDDDGNVDHDDDSWQICGSYQ